MTATHRLIPFRINQARIRGTRKKPESMSLFDEILILALQTKEPPTGKLLILVVAALSQGAIGQT
jgi:hypothetical protein